MRPLPPQYTERDRVDGATGAAADPRKDVLIMRYFDLRGIFRVYHMSVDNATWRM